MIISLRQFLQTGCLGELRTGLPPEEVRGLLGEPDDVGGTSRKYPRPCIYVYGAVELYFQRQRPFSLTTIHWEAVERGEFCLSERCVVQDWDLTPGMAREQVEAFLRSHELAFQRQEHPSLPTTDLLLPSGVKLSFDENGQLYSIYAW